MKFSPRKKLRSKAYKNIRNSWREKIQKCQIALEKIQLGKSNFHQVKFIFYDNIIFNLRLYNNF